jgi:CNT family concentrative nucleoside transporter
MIGCRPTVIVGLVLQQCIALFVLKTGAGFSIFKWIATLASDFLSQSLVGARFFFDVQTVSRGWFFVNVVSISVYVVPILVSDLLYCQLAAVIFFMAFVQMMYYVSANLSSLHVRILKAVSQLGVMQWIIKHLCVLYLC